jgi:hypothetical protein
VRVGDLVRTTRRSIEIPEGSIGLVLECATHGNKRQNHGQEYCTWEIMINGRLPRRYLEMDLEVISASR